jgi:eukaryotic-like serine/threonine-protein kinase
LMLGKGKVKVTIEKEGFISAIGHLVVSSLSPNPRQEITLRRTAEAEIQAAEPEPDPGDEGVDPLTKALTLLEERQFETALALFLDLRRQDAENLEIEVHIGKCYEELQRYGEALQAFKSAAQRMEAGSSPSPPGKRNHPLAAVYASMGDIYLRQNKFPEAVAVLKKSLAFDPSDHEMAYKAGDLLFAAGKTSEAIPYYELALRLKPDCAVCYRQLGYASLKQGDTKAAVRNLGKYLEMAPDAPEALEIKEILQSSR